ncbi:hypothetical protein DFH06DRAFT_1342620 [Mycena polygramma]|nr:hypothetical protein DFH06DRAFT_1342620 [Mycena polygramma]
MSDKVVKMWSAVHRKERTIFESCNTNMLVEAWHHVLKGKFFNGKRNRRLDHLLHTLLKEVLAYYALKQRRQEVGFEGPDIEVKKRKDIIERSKTYTKADVQQVSDTKYSVRSKSDPSKQYEVDLDTYTCTCLDYPLISFCKHLCAVQTLFEETPRVVAVLDIPSLAPIPLLPTPDVRTTSTPSPSAPPISKRRPLTVLAEKLERLAARLRRPLKKDSDALSFTDLETALDATLRDTDNGAVLPSSQYLPPNKSSSWSQTQQAMLPGIKMKKKPAGDPSYGAGASSGAKAKDKKSGAKKDKSVKTTTSPQPQPSQGPSTAPPLLAPKPTMHYPQPTFPTPSYPQPFAYGSYPYHPNTQSAGPPWAYPPVYYYPPPPQ